MNHDGTSNLILCSFFVFQETFVSGKSLSRAQGSSQRPVTETTAH